MKTTITTRLLSAFVACLTTAALLGSIDTLATTPAPDALLAHTPADAVRSAT